MGQFTLHTLQHWYTCCIYYILQIIQVHQYILVQYTTTYYYYMYTGTYTIPLVQIQVHTTNTTTVHGNT